MKVTYKSLTERIKRAETAKETCSEPLEPYWDGYIQGRKDLRDSNNSKD